MQANVQQAVMEAIQYHLSVSINPFVATQSIDQILQLVLKLKALANPQSIYSSTLEDPIINDFNRLLSYPHGVLRGIDYNPDEYLEECRQIREMICIQFNTTADSIINIYHLQDAFTREIQRNENEATMRTWWENKSAQEKEAIQQQYENLSERQRKQLQQLMPAPQQTTVYVGYVDPFPYYWMCFYHSHLLSCCYLDLAHFSAHLVSHAAFSFPHLISHTSGGSGSIFLRHGGGGIKSEDKARIYAIAGLVALALSGIIGGLYALKKAFNSMTNLLNGEKMLRSLFRLSGIAGGACSGAVLGVIAGAAIGSLIPGLGTAAGALLGSIFGAGLGSGLGAFITKYTAKFFSWLYHGGELNPTNLTKYKLNSAQKAHLTTQGFNPKNIEYIIEGLYTEKRKMGWTASIPFTGARKNKKEFNKLLDQLKKGEIQENMIEIGRDLYFIYHAPIQSPSSFSSTATVMQVVGCNPEGNAGNSASPTNPYTAPPSYPPSAPSLQTYPPPPYEAPRYT